MKKKMYQKKRFSFLSLVVVLMFVATGCGSNGMTEDTMAYDMVEETAFDEGGDFGYSNELKSEMGVMETEEAYVEAPSADGNSSQGADIEDVSQNRKLIKQTNLNLETLEYDVFIESLEALIEETGGYIEYSDQSNRSYFGYENEGRYASYTIRIPVSTLDAFVNQVGNMANVRSKNEQISDVTLSYVDLESKQEMYEIEQENLMELLDRADTVEDMIIIESRLTEIRYQLQSMESQLRTYDNLVDYATITVYVNEVVRLEPSEEAPAGERIRTGFKNSLHKIIDDLKEFGIRFIIALPVIILDLLIFVIFALLVFLIVKKAIKKNKKNRIKQMVAIQKQAINQDTEQKKKITENGDTKK